MPLRALGSGATYCKARLNHRIVSLAVLITTGHREILGLMVADSESKPFWTNSCAHCGPALWRTISHSHSGLMAAIRTSPARHGRCRVHFVWDVFSVIERGSGEMDVATIRTVFA